MLKLQPFSSRPTSSANVGSFIYKFTALLGQTAVGKDPRTTITISADRKTITVTMPGTASFWGIHADLLRAIRVQ
ncbi:MAG: hypothetical protein H0V56_01660 [Chthoniobacterales bacterium]|nr:hypothetical protein [Chthoniobacterales bacterium]